MRFPPHGSARRRVLAPAVLALALAGPLAAPAATAGARADRAPDDRVAALSRPDIAAEAPALTTKTTGAADDRPLLVTPGTDSTGGVGIYDNSGELIWWGGEGGHTNLAATTYRGEPVLSVHKGKGAEGRYVLLDRSYREVASFRMKGCTTDVHDFRVSPDGERVLLMGYHPVPYDLSAYGGPKDATVTDAVIQEQDIDTGEVTFEWSALDHVPVTETQLALTEKDVDFFHINSFAYEPDGGLLVSARHTSTVYKLTLPDGDIAWRLGGTNSDYSLPSLADAFSFQHDARRLKDGSISVFDNGNLATPQRSRGAVYTLDDGQRTAKLTRDLQPDPPVYGSYTGGSAELPGGNMLVSYGETGLITEFRGDEPVFTGRWPDGWFSYRAERADWHGTPAKRPDAVVRDGTLAVSWNGATEVASWRLSADGETRTVRKSGFETRTAPPGDDGPVKVTALDDDGHALAGRTVRR
ncbi:arylsulfotransferase family protein [Streptomyces cacaoi]|uniref:Arylsulfotransferase ASST n=2 Tax=Streptomyces cacaoi TaxID=1898 RepID=A0A4Y3R2T9_STRCI|nr:arylsulfotransferase family protein [Streptomyces cacaoi]GEB51911.1 hypothetical protein SCA03_44620 [Streptomyces cacaoi]